eukprot:TRINITY_DN25039_c0_g1_i8.p1 TRINITY_DN25039_c0_g1~~TRINITY_DN25039_c0_g1_i8.p1  ORF type:complete len:231 (+),score=42.96 TRINITY_DN25039_c0_g1_i8:232-924(+)
MMSVAAARGGAARLAPHGSPACLWTIRRCSRADRGGGFSGAARPATTLRAVEARSERLADWLGRQKNFLEEAKALERQLAAERYGKYESGVRAIVRSGQMAAAGEMDLPTLAKMHTQDAWLAQMGQGDTPLAGEALLQLLEELCLCPAFSVEMHQPGGLLWTHAVCRSKEFGGDAASQQFFRNQVMRLYFEKVGGCVSFASAWFSSYMFGGKLHKSPNTFTTYPPRQLQT